MQDEEKKWIDKQIKAYEEAIRIAVKLNNKEKLQEYEEELKRLKDSLRI